MSHVPDESELDRDDPPASAPPPFDDDAWAMPSTDDGVGFAAPVAPAAPERLDDQPAGLGSRVVRRVLRRPTNWLDAPWTPERVARVVTTFVIVSLATLILLHIMRYRLVFRDNTPTGGDMGAHVMGPAYLRDHLLNSFKISGWNPYWYDGFPMYRFYMVIPALMIIALNVVLPYGIAFKIVAIAGALTLPLCCWAFGRLSRFAFPIPELFALGALLFVLEDTKELAILGGTVKSTMAGEFSFSIALSFAMLGLGFFARGLETGKHRALTAVLLALAVLSHGIVAIFVLVAAGLMALIWMDRTRLLYSVTTLLPMGLLTSFWILPFVSGQSYMTDMKYEARPSGAGDSYWKMFFNLDVTLDRIVFTLALIGFIGAVVRRHLLGAWLGITILALAMLCRFTENEHKGLPLIGLLWNPRVLPFIYLLRYLLMMVGIVEVGRAVVWLIVRARAGAAAIAADRRGATSAVIPLPSTRSQTIGGVTTALSTFIVVLLILAVQFQHPFFMGGVVDGRYSLSIGPDGNELVLYKKRATGSDALADSWSRYNFLGYEGRDAYGEYRAVVTAMAEIGSDPDHGCGRALWENNERNGQYGTTMALMLLPHWTDGCIGSSEGLFFEASGTTPYHFIAAAALSAKSSNPVRELRYTNNDAQLGVRYLQDLGIRYYMAWTDEAVREAETVPELTLIRESGPWHIYQVADSDIVTPLTVQPVVVGGRSDDRETWLELGTSWFQNPSEWPAIPADDGPASWQRVDAVVDSTRSADRRVEVVVPASTIEPVALDPVVVSNVEMGNESVSFDVDQIGVPVLVKVSYFPNWNASGADGPYRIAPNLMVVVPTANHVELTFDRSTLDYAAYVLTLLGIVLLFVFARWVPIRPRSAQPQWSVDPVDPTAPIGAMWAPTTAESAPPLDAVGDDSAGHATPPQGQPNPFEFDSPGDDPPPR